MSKPNRNSLKKLIIPITISIMGLSLVGSSDITKAQESDLIWLNTFGGSGSDSFADIEETTDGGFIAVGDTDSANGDFTTNRGFYDFVLAKFDSSGNKEWIKTYGGSNYDSFYKVQPTIDGGYIAVGSSDSNNGDIPGNKGSDDFIIAKFDKNGDKEWVKNYGGNNKDVFNFVVQLDNGDFIAVGLTASSNGDITSPKGTTDGVIARFDSNGNKRWIKNIGGSKQERIATVEQTQDGNLILSANSSSVNGDLIGNRGLADFVFAKYDINGNQLWSKSYGGSKSESLEDVFETTDGEFIGMGYSDSTDGDIGVGKGSYDAIVIKLDKNGNKIWLRKIGGSSTDVYFNGFETLDGGYIASGTTSSNNGDITENKGVGDILITKYDKDGNKEWLKTIGGSGTEQTNRSLLTSDGDYVFAGLSTSTELTNKGSFDSLFMKIEGDKTPPDEISNLGEVHNFNSITLNWDNPTNDDFSHINIYRNGTLINTSTNNTYSDISLNDGTKYDYRITTVDRLNNESIGSTITVKTDDVTAPSLPTNFSGKGKDGTIQLWWDPNVEPDFDGYNIYIDGVKKNDQLITENNYEISGLTVEQIYHASISAVDTLNNESPLSEALDIRVMDTIAPGQPTNFSGKGQDGTIQLWWDSNVEPDFAGYNIYIDGVKRNEQLITENNYEISGFTNDQVYKASVSAVDTSNNESPLSVALDIRVKDTIAPSKPNISSAIFDPKTGNLSVIFEKNLEEDFFGFNIYVNDVLFNQNILTELNVKLNLLPGTYKIFAVSLDKFMNESVSSPIMDVIVNEIKDDLGPEEPEVPEEPGKEVIKTPNNPKPKPGAFPPNSGESNPDSSTYPSTKPKSAPDDSKSPGSKTPSSNPNSKNKNSKNEQNVIDETELDTKEGNKQTQKEELEEKESKNTDKETEVKEKESKPEKGEFNIKEFIEKNILVGSIIFLVFGILLVRFLIKKK